ncbi:MAG: hypothetical protein K6F05_09040 [Succinivibrio sp.]|nr:hypothetical protein [Succinivibrio sp.]
MKNLLQVLTLVALTILMSACAHRHSEIYEPYGSVPSSLSIEQVQNAIERACVQYRWSIDSKTPGIIRARQYMNKWGAVVNIHYDRNSYHIYLAEAYGLRYNQARHTIHGHYNTWVSNLAQAINEQLSYAGLSH